MKLTVGGALGFAVVVAIVLAASWWVATRRLLHSPYPSTPWSAVQSGWRAVFLLIRQTPLVALAAFAIKLFQSASMDVENIFLRHSLRSWSVVGLAIQLIFSLAWAAFAIRIYLRVLAPDATAEQVRLRTRRAVLYALSFWAVTILVTLAGIGLVIAAHGADHGKVMRGVGYFSTFLTVVAALSRPAIATGLAKPIRECMRILRENWFGAAVTLVLAALPLGLVFLAVGQFVIHIRLALILALILELPVAALSALCYAAFEGVIAAMYKRIM